MQFDVKNFEVTADNDVKITFKNVGKLPKIAMGHNLVLAQKRNNGHRFRTESPRCRC